MARNVERNPERLRWKWRAPPIRTQCALDKPSIHDYGINPPERKTYLGDNASVATAAGILVERQRFQRVAVLPNVILGFVVPF